MWENCGSTGFARASRMCLTRDGPWTRSLDQEEMLKLWSKAPGHRRKGDLREELQHFLCLLLHTLWGHARPW